MTTLQQTTDVVRNTEIPVYAGSQLLTFGVNQMPPNTKIYTYCNGVNITPFTAPITEGALIGDSITTDQLGAARGYLYIPSGEGKYKFLTGEILLTFSDSPNGIASSKYISETILFNHGLNLVDTEQGGTISLRTTEKFRTSPLGSSSDTNTSQDRLDPLSQSFIVDATRYPLGVYVTGINLYFYEKDDKLPVGVELRPMENGKPSTTEYMSGSYTLKNPVDVKVYDKTASKAETTTFTFAHPIFLKPGEYAFCVLTKSDKYLLLSAKVGDGKTVKQPFAGKLFKAQNTGDWVGDENEDLTFVMRKAKFNTGTVVIEAQTKDMGITEFNRLRLLSTAIDFGDTATATYKVSTTTAGSLTKSDYINIIPGTDAVLQGRQVAALQGDVKFQISLTTKNADVSPTLDKQLLKAQVFRNRITEYTEAISASELNPNNGTAGSRYISKPVSLAEGFDSTGLEVKLDVNRKIGTDVEVFCRVLSRDDKAFTNGIVDRSWVKMPLVAPSAKSFAGASETKFSTETYKILEPGLAYSVTANATSNASVTASYENFAHYQVKVVFYANNPVYIPKIKNLVATSVL